ncbi:hypothetical protein RFI_12404 [Reticulomyxa filosa]|uniref:Uncharacterized protein n=1 Tax=Reticulomyxa filosa TaxID=46433 RepID=X6NEJ6_RETFI|nr:hypothetical protein RFI_12404 [Reticulomyxa filosa]|eukprot:ETO24755.1 hypothetical protein RFI_12404 [Reticulomyxa filosa]
MTIKSIYGCPTQCGIYGHSLCGGNGLCSYDWQNTKAGCFCYWNRGGAACEEEVGTKAYKALTSNRIPDAYMHTFISNVTWNNLEGETQVTNVNVTYDLSPFHLTDTAYTVKGNDTVFSYVWNFLGNVPSDLSKDCGEALGPCTSNCDSSFSEKNGDTLGAAFQINSDNNNCNLLARGNSYKWALYDSQDPARGVSFTYLDGGYCASENTNREFTINFVCPSSAKKYPSPEKTLSLTSYVEESDAHLCHYSLTWETAAACPYQCVGDGSQYTVCNGRGICAADPIAGSVRCLCDANFEGDWCETSIQPSTTTTAAASHSDSHVGLQVAISIVTILVIVFIAVSLYLYIRNRSLEKFRGQLLDEDADDITSPPLHTEPKVPDDMSDSDSEADKEKAENDDEEEKKFKNKKSKKSSDATSAETAELVTIEPPKETADNKFDIKLEGPPTG